MLGHLALQSARVTGIVVMTNSYEYWVMAT